jgi:heat shock protein HslJ
MKKVFLLVLALGMVFTIIGASGCSSSTGTDLEGKKWLLESYGDPDSPQAVIKDTRVTAEFSEGEVTGIAGCNNYFGSYEVSGKSLTFGPVANTEMYCMDPEGVMDQETDYLTALQSAKTYEITAGKLQITYSGNQVLTFTEE